MSRKVTKEHREWQTIDGSLLFDALNYRLNKALIDAGVVETVSNLLVKKIITRVIDILGGTVLKWPRDIAVLRKHRKDAIVKDFQTNSYADVAKKWNLSERRIRSIVGEGKCLRRPMTQNSMIDMENIILTELYDRHYINKENVRAFVSGVLQKVHVDIGNRKTVYVTTYSVINSKLLKKRIEFLSDKKSIEEIARIIDISESEVCRIQALLEN